MSPPGSLSSRRRERRIETLAERDGGMRCYWCSGRLTQRMVTFDHVVPKSQGGTMRLSNLVLACRPCNARRADSGQPLVVERRVAERWPLTPKVPPPGIEAHQ